MTLACKILSSYLDLYNYSHFNIKKQQLIKMIMGIYINKRLFVKSVEYDVKARTIMINLKWVF